MQQIMQLASEIYMIALCLLVGPTDQKVTRIDQVNSRGILNTVIVERTDQGFSLYEDKKGQRVPLVTLQRQQGKQGVFMAKEPNGRQEVIDLSVEFANLESLNAPRRGEEVLKTKNGSEIQ